MPKYHVDGLAYARYAHAPDLNIDGEIIGARLRMGLDSQMKVETPESIQTLAKATKIEENDNE